MCHVNVHKLDGEYLVQVHEVLFFSPVIVTNFYKGFFSLKCEVTIKSFSVECSDSSSKLRPLFCFDHLKNVKEFFIQVCPKFFFHAKSGTINNHRSGSYHFKALLVVIGTTYKTFKQNFEIDRVLNFFWSNFELIRRACWFTVGTFYLNLVLLKRNWFLEFLSAIFINSKVSAKT